MKDFTMDGCLFISRERIRYSGTDGHIWEKYVLTEGASIYSGSRFVPLRTEYWSTSLARVLTRRTTRKDIIQRF